MRPSMVHPLTRKNPGDNSGERVPNFEFDYIPEQEFLDIILSFKGCGAELGNAMKVFTTAQLGKDYSGLKRFVLETVTKAGGVPCPPIAVSYTHLECSRGDPGFWQHCRRERRRLRKLQLPERCRTQYGFSRDAH